MIPDAMKHRARSSQLRRLLLALALPLALALLAPLAAHALSPGQVSFSAITPYAALDSNNCASSGPRAMYLQVDVANTSGGTLTGMSASISSLNGTGFAFDAGESQYRYIGTLANGAVAHLYYYVNYPCTYGTVATYTVSVSDSNAGIVTSSVMTLTTRSEISANAGGDVTTATLGAGAVVGQIIPLTVTYSFGNPAAGADAMIQPAGNVSFDASCFTLMAVDVLSVGSFTSGLLPSSDNRLYFPSVAGGSSNTATVVYSFKSLCNGVSTVANPFADLKSGGQLKYTGNFGGTPINFPAATNPFTFSLSVTPTSLPSGGVVTYTVRISNTSSFDALLDRITTTHSSGITYGGITSGSQITTGNSSEVPSAGSTGTMHYVSLPNVTYNIPANSAIDLIFTATLTSTSGNYSTIAKIGAGNTELGPQFVQVAVGSPTAVSLRSLSAYGEPPYLLLVILGALGAAALCWYWRRQLQ